MAEKRMFSKKITNSDNFLEMPASAQVLYFHLNMNADDDGFVNNPKSIMRLCSATEDNLKILEAKRFILKFDTGVIVIRQWRINNTLRKDRYNSTICQEEFSKLIEINGEYELEEIAKTDSRLPQYSIGKSSIGKNILGNDNTQETDSNLSNIPTLEEATQYANSMGLKKVNVTKWYWYYSKLEWKSNGKPMKNWKQSLIYWNSTEKTPDKKVKLVPDWYKELEGK